jgi:hypothetical protein
MLSLKSPPQLLQGGKFTKTFSYMSPFTNEFGLGNIATSNNLQAVVQQTPCSVLHIATVISLQVVYISNAMQQFFDVSTLECVYYHQSINLS